MMKRIYSKLKSNSGASIILVLVLFLICVMVSSVIVMAASTGASRNANRKRQQQGYLSITSAVEFIVAEINESGKYVGKVECLDYGCNIEGEQVYMATHNGETLIDEESNAPHVDITENTEGVLRCTDYETSALGGVFRGMLEDACTEIYVNKQTNYTTSFVIEAEDERLSDVSCEFIMDSAYNIIMVLSAADCDYKMTVRFAGSIENSNEPSVISCTHQIKYNLIVNGSLIPGQTKEIHPSGKKTIKRTTVTWGLPSVTKGGYTYVVE